MKKKLFPLTIFFVFFIMCGTVFSLELGSSAFENGGYIPKMYTCKGEDVSPPLKWSDVPLGTKSFVLIMDDPDAPIGTWVHWVVYDIPPEVNNFGGNVEKKPVFPNGMKHGMTSFRRIGYGGPCPPKGPAHRYFFKLYALDTVLNLPPGIIKEELLASIEGHVIEEAELEGLFKK